MKDNIKRNKTLDGIKAISIISIVFYHMGKQPYGFLGVDIFFVIAGYLTTISIQRKIEKGCFNCARFIADRLKRIYPAVVISSLVCLAIGYIGMLPDDYENLSEQIIASNLLSENVLSAITTGDYWNVVNDYKPLMHMWYVGVLFEFYLFYSVCYALLNRTKKSFNCIHIGIVILTILSLFVYLLPCVNDSVKFYYLPFRFFEFGVGALIVLFQLKHPNKEIYYISAFVILVLLTINNIDINNSARLLAINAFTTLLLITEPNRECLIGNPVLSFIGARSYSLFIWHQILLAFYRYFVSNHLDIEFVIGFWVIILTIMILSAELIENKLGKAKSSLIICAVLFLLTSLCSGMVYLHAGVVRDIPELNIYKDNVHRNMHAEYCDRPYNWDKEFSQSGKIKVLVIGNSFGRDWSNILKEYDKNNDLEISYFFYTDESFREKNSRVKDADYVFYSLGPDYEDVPSVVLNSVEEEKLYIVGNKSFGESNGIVYSHRLSDDYFDQTVAIPDELIKENEISISKYGDHYIDMLKPVMANQKQVIVFTDDNKFISQDCRHLTESGAIYYSKLLDLSFLKNR